MIIRFIILFLFTISIQAQELKTLNKGDIAPFKGVLVDQKQMKEFRKINEKNMLLKKQTVTLKDLAFVKDQKIEYFKNETTEWKSRYRREQFWCFWEKTGFFVLGVVLTGAAAKYTIETLK